MVFSLRHSVDMKHHTKMTANIFVFEQHAMYCMTKVLFLDMPHLIGQILTSRRRGNESLRLVRCREVGL